MSTSGEINELFLNDGAYTAGSFVSPWLKYGFTTNISMFVKSDQTFTITCDFAIDDGFIIVDSESVSNIDPTLSSTLTVKIKTRYVKFTVSGIPNPSNIKCQGFYFENNDKITAHVPSGISISNLPLGGFGDLRTAEVSCKIAYAFVASNFALLKDNNIQCNYPDLQSGTQVNSGGSTASVIGRVFKLSMAGVIDNYAWIQGKTIRYVSGTSGNYRFTMSFETSDSDLGSALRLGVGYREIDFFGFGWDDDGIPNTYDTFGIIYIINGTLVHIPRTAWNGDKCDGTGALPVLVLSNLNVVQIGHTYLGSGNIRFQIMTPSGDWVTVHTIIFPNSRTTSTASDPSFGLIMYGYIPLGAVIGSGSDRCGMASLAIQHDGRPQEIVELFSAHLSGRFKTIGSGAETVILSLYNHSAFQGSLVHTPISISDIEIAVDGTKTCFVECYINSTIVAPTYTYVNNYTSLQKDEVGTVGTYGRDIESFSISKTGTLTRTFTSPVILSVGDVFTVTAFSTGVTDVFCSINYHVM